VLRNQFDYRKPVKDTQFYELTFKYREPWTLGYNAA
jgi:hypothetical protein